MEEASAGMLFLAGGGDAERVVRVLVLVVVDSAAGSFAVFSLCAISLVLLLLLLLLLLAVMAFFILLGTSKEPSEGVEVVVVRAGPGSLKVSNSAFGAGRFLDDRRLPYSPRSPDDHLDESVLRVNLPEDDFLVNFPEDARLVRLRDWRRAGIDAEAMMDFGFGDFGFGAGLASSTLKPSLRSSRSSLLHLPSMAGALLCRRLTLSSSVSIGLGLFITSIAPLLLLL